MCSQQSRLTKKSNAKKTLANIEMARVKSVRRTRSRRMKFCVQRGLGGIPQQARGAIWIATGIACRFLCRNEKSQRGNRQISLTGSIRFNFLR